MHVLLFANGQLTQGRMLQKRLRQHQASAVLCADGGALQARACGLIPRAIIGDLDSLAAEEVAQFQAEGAEIIQYPPEKDETDLELSLLHCRDIGAEAVTVLGALGGRFDHSIANALLLTLPAFSQLPVELVDGDQAIRLLRPGAHEILGQPGDTISLIPLGGDAHGISTDALQYPLRSGTLQMGPARGISNVMLSERAAVDLRAGLLLLVHTIGRA